MYDGFLKGLEKFLNENPELSNTRIATNNFQIPSMINFYLEPKLEATCLSIGYQQTLYSFLYPNITQKNDDFIFIKHGMGFPKFLENHFTEILPLKEFKVRRGEQILSNFSLWHVKDFSGEK